MDFPIKRVVLFKHGIGFFSRSGTVEGETAFPLYFHVDSMNDVLKSLTIFDVTGGHISSLSYENTKPIEKQLEDIAFRLNEKSSLLDILRQIKGAAVTLTKANGQVKGTVIGLQARVRQDASGKAYTQNLLSVLVDGARVDTTDVAAITSLTVEGESLRGDLEHLYSVLLQSKARDQKCVTVFASGKGQRTLCANYITEAPVWKTTYRLILTSRGDSNNSSALIQGWAIVDNTGKEDWDDIEVVLMSGTSNSFTHDIYKPRFKKRVELAVVEEEAVAPPVLEDAIASFDMDSMASASEARCMDEEEMEEERAPMRDRRSREKKMARRSSYSKEEECVEEREASYGRGGGGMGPLRSLQASSAVPSMLTSNALGSSLVVDTDTKKIEATDLFQYNLANTVTVRRNESALVPFLQTKVAAKRMAVYNEQVRADSPLSVVFFKNTTGMALEGGPMTLYEDDVYVGEAMFGTSAPEASVYVPFAVELKCRVTKEVSRERRPHYRTTVDEGRIYFNYLMVTTTTYVLESKRDKDLDLVLEHRIEGSLFETERLFKRSDHFYSFSLCVPANQTVKFVTKEISAYQSDSYYCLPHTQSGWEAEDVMKWQESGKIDEKTAAAIMEAKNIGIRINELTVRMSRVEALRRRIYETESRLNSILNSLNERGDATGQKYFKERMAANTSDRIPLDNELATITTEIARLRKCLEEACPKIKYTKDYSTPFSYPPTIAYQGELDPFTMKPVASS